MKKVARQKITPFLWFDANAEEAARFYVSIFKDAKILEVSRYPEGSPAPAGSVMTVTFQIEGQRFIALNGGPHFKFSEAVSLVVDCATQAEVDRLWDKLGDGGEPQMCGWVKDKFGFPWQVVPSRLDELLTDPDPAKASRAMKAMLGMQKIEIAEIERAARGDGAVAAKPARAARPARAGGAAKPRGKARAKGARASR